MIFFPIFKSRGKNLYLSYIKFFKKIFFLAITVLILNSYLYPILGGRTKPFKPEQIQWIYGENQDNRTIAFLEFENLTKTQKEIYDNYKTSLPRIIAERIKNIKNIETPSNDFIPIYKNINSSYLVKEISFSNAEKNIELMNQVFHLGKVQSFYSVEGQTNINDQKNPEIGAPQLAIVNITTNIITNQTSLGEMIKTNYITNDINKATFKDLDFFSTLTNRQVAYYYTNEVTKKYVFYIFKKDPLLYFDPQLLAPYQKYFVSNDDFPLPTNEKGQTYYPIDKIPKKKFNLSEKLYRLNESPLGNILSQEKIDYFVYGSFNIQRNNMELNLYIINAHEKKITHIYRERFPSSKIHTKVKALDTLVMGFLQKKKVVKNINFTSDPPGALLRIDNRFIGSLPQKLNHWVEGEYKYEVWYPNQKVSRVTSQNKITTKKVDFKKSNSHTQFVFKSKKKGVLDISINNGIPGDYYINSKLVGKNRINYVQELYSGDYFVRVVRSNHVTRNFKINVDPNTKTYLGLDLIKVKPKSRFEEIFLDYNLNTKIFATLGFAFGAASFGSFIHTLRLEDQKNSSQKRLEELTESGLDTKDETSFRDELNKDYNKFLGISLGLFSGSVVSFITMLIFHTLDVWENHAPIETTFNHKGDVEIKYTKNF